MSVYGTKATIRGSQATIDASESAWSTVTADDQIVVQSYTFTPVFDVQEEANQTGATIAAAVDEVKFELQLSVLVTGSSIANAKVIELPVAMSKIVIIGADNDDVNGDYNFVGGSVTGENKGVKKMSLTLRAYQGADFDPANKVALAVIAS